MFAAVHIVMLRQHQHRDVHDSSMVFQRQALQHYDLDQHTLIRIHITTQTTAIPLTQHAGVLQLVVFVMSGHTGSFALD